MSEARHAARARFLAVGLFLSVLLANSQQVIEHMKKVWKIRGRLEANQVEAAEGRKYILEFSEEGDRDHVVRGGPWQYKGDAFLVEGPANGADPASALFTHVPIWVQFRNIPDYLLTKKLAFDLGDQVGTSIKIDNVARGNLDDKFIRTRIQLPLYTPLQKEITLIDRMTRKEVEAQLRYERLPNFYLFCGFIGHMEARCDVPAADRRLCFNQELRVPPVYFDDLGAWYLPDDMGQEPAQSSNQGPWHAPRPAGGRIGEEMSSEQSGSSVHPAVEVVAEHVARLRVGDTNKNTSQAGAIMPTTAAAVTNTNHNATIDIDSGASGDEHNDIDNTKALNTDNGVMVNMHIDTNKDDKGKGEKAAALDKNLGATATGNSSNNTMNQADRVGVHATTNVATTIELGDKVEAARLATWKRKKREEGVEEKKAKAASQTQELNRVRQGPEGQSEDEYPEQLIKRSYIQVPTLSECLGKEGLRKLREAERMRPSASAEMNKEALQEGGEENGGQASKGEKEATGPGATGPLSGADDSAWQAQ